MARSKLIILVAIICALVGSSVYFLIFKSSNELIPLKRGDIHEAVYGLGKVKSNKIYELKVGVLVTILKLYVREGSQVEKGQILARLSEGSAFPAPFSGMITFLPFHENENAFPQFPILRIEDLNDLYVEVSLEQQGALRVSKGQSAQLSFESLRGSVINGVIDSVFPKEDQFVVRINSGKLPQGVLPGMTTDVAIHVGQKKDVLLIPLAAVTNGRATVVKGGKKMKIPVVIGAVDGDWAEVISGDLNIEDQAVVVKR